MTLLYSYSYGCIVLSIVWNMYYKIFSQDFHEISVFCLHAVKRQVYTFFTLVYSIIYHIHYLENSLVLKYLPRKTDFYFAHFTDQ